MNTETEVSLSTIETSCKKLREARDQVSDLVRELQSKIDTLQADYIRRIKGAANRTADLNSELYNLVDGNRHLFVKPRTVTFHGINCGVEKGKGKIEYDDADAVIKAAEKKLPEKLDTIAPVGDRKLLKNVLKTLTVAELKSIGCTVEETGDRVIVRYTDKEVDKLVNALLKNATDEAIAEAA